MVELLTEEVKPETYRPWNSSKITSGDLDVRMINRNLQSQSDQRVYDGGTVYRGLGLRSGQRGTSNGIANKSSGFWLDEEAVMLN